MLLEWRLKEKMGYDRIAGRLTELGIPTPKGKAAWSHTSIHSLTGEMSRLFQYCGYAFWGREDCRDKRNRRMRDPSEWTVVEHAHPAIVSEEDCEAIWAMVTERQKPKSGRSGESSRFALSGGLLKCGTCGANYAGAKRGKNDYYVCGSHLYRRGAGCAQSWYIPREELETTLLRRILKYLDRDDAAMEQWVRTLNDELTAEWQAYESTAGDRRKRLAQLEKEQKNLSSAIADAGPISSLVSRLQETEAYIVRLRRLQSAERPPEITPDALVQYRDRVMQGLHDDATRRDVLKELVIEGIVNTEERVIDCQMADPRSIVYISVAAPRGVEPLSRP